MFPQIFLPSVCFLFAAHIAVVTCRGLHSFDTEGAFVFLNKVNRRALLRTPQWPHAEGCTLLMLCARKKPCDETCERDSTGTKHTADPT